MQRRGNIYGGLGGKRDAEEFLPLVSAPSLSIERIVSTGQATPAGEWLCQDRAEWVILLQGRAALSFASEKAPLVLAAGDYVNIPANCRHRVEWTDAAEATVWLAVHYDG